MKSPFTRTGSGVLLWLMPAWLSAQRLLPLPALDSGTAVRLDLRSGQRVAGKLVAPFTPDSARFRFCRYPAPPCIQGGDRYAELLAADVLAIQVRTGTKIVPGAVLGTLFGLGVGFATLSFSDSKPSFSRRVATLGVSVLIVGGIGLSIGAGSDEWGTPR
jgi:hypothetical protein